MGAPIDGVDSSTGGGEEKGGALKRVGAALKGGALSGLGKEREDSSGKAQIDAQRAETMGRLAATQSSTERLIDSTRQPIPSFKRGGTMRKSGVARLHRGEKAVRSKDFRGQRGGKRC